MAEIAGLRVPVYDIAIQESGIMKLFGNIGWSQFVHRFITGITKLAMDKPKEKRWR